MQLTSYKHLVFLFSILFFATSTFAALSDAFIITVKTDNEGDSNSTQFTIPTASGLSYDYSVDCENDGGLDPAGLSDDYTCNYSTAGTYTIAIYGTFPRIVFNNGGDKDKILSINQWGTQQWSAMQAAFYGCSNLNISATDTPDLSHVTDASLMFKEATNFNSPIGDWNVSTIVNFSFMLSSTSFNQDISAWDLSSARYMSSMFMYSPFNQDISSWDVSGITNMTQMFFDNHEFNQDIGEWNVSQVTSMQNMFLFAYAFNQDISDWNISNVSNATTMFSNISVSNYNNMLNSWAKLQLQNDVSFGAGGSPTSYSDDANVSHQYIIDTFNWTFDEFGYENGFHITTPYHFSATDGKTFVGTVISNHNESNCYQISGGSDGNLFDINTTSGVLSFKIAPNIKSPNDKNGDGIYRVQVHATDCKGSANDYQTIRVNVEHNNAVLVPISTYLLF